MDINQIIGYILAVAVGITLGLVGSGGSILSVPILVYIMGIEPVLATAYSLFIVGCSALFGGIQKAQQQLVDFQKVISFGIPSIVAVFLTRKLIIPNVPDVIFATDFFTLHKSVMIMVLFSIVMIFAATRMITTQNVTNLSDDNQTQNYGKIITQGGLIGCTAGFVGAGGGFLIIPALLFLTKIPMKKAIGTSLIIVAFQSLIGFIGDIRPEQDLDWKVLLIFTSCAILGILIGNQLSKKIDGSKLKTAFGWFVLSMGVYIIMKELFFH
jgi:uncharacterized membrane protein YfcA